MNPFIGVIGAGNMGAAFYRGLLKQFPSSQLGIADHDESKLAEFSQTFTATNFKEVIAKSDLIFLAIKPQSFEGFCEQLNLDMDIQEKCVLSIMAGVSIQKIQESMRLKKVVRSMPNLPVQVSHGVTGWIASPQVEEYEKDLVKKIFSGLGKEVELDNEDLLNPLTALSGSGPAYFFYLCELMMEQAKIWGFSEEEAQLLANETLIGSALLLKEKNTNPAELRSAVTSKGGTTEAALTHMKNSKMDSIFKDALEAARKRSIQLNSSENA